MSLRWNDEARTLDLGVHDLLETQDGARARWAGSGAARLRAGVGLHRDVQTARAADDGSFAAEVPLRHSVVVRGWTCTVHGRVDGVSEEGGRTVLEEIKSSTLGADALGSASGFPAWERQLAFYVLFAAAARMPDPIGRLRVVSLVDGAQRISQVPRDPTLDAWLIGHLEALVRVREDRIAWQARRKQRPPRFAHDAPRPGQLDIAAAIEDAGHRGQHLLVVAPTGIGKTAAVLYGALRVAADRGLRVWWATARGTQQAIVERTAAEMAERGTPLRSVTLRAREKACRRGGEPCVRLTCPASQAPESCDAALDALMELGQPSADALAAVAAACGLCPYTLANVWLQRCDLVIGDYNYVFDPDVRLRTPLAEEPHLVVVEEAHQLPDRAAEWGSPALSSRLVAELLAVLPAEGAWRPFRTLALDIAEALADAALLTTAGGEGTTLQVELNVRRWVALRDAVDDLGVAYAALVQPVVDGLRSVLPPASPPPAFPSAPPTPADPWVALARAVARFVDALERAGEETVALWSPEPPLLAGSRAEVPGATLALVCRDPSRLLGPRFAGAWASVSISATLAPTWFYRERCGIEPERLVDRTVESPFLPENRRVIVVGGVSTAMRDRDRDRDRIVALVTQTLAAVPGNAAVYFGSFEQAREVMGGVVLPDREILVQTSAMDEGDRARMLDRMRNHTEARPRVLVGVLGGLFAEGVDLPGSALQAVLVVGPALPPPSLERRLLQAWHQERFDQGFELAYIHPGMTRVVQAAGRVVRGPTDRGVVVLICQRFLRHAYADYLPAAWLRERSRRPWEAVTAFFAERGAPT